MPDAQEHALGVDRERPVPLRLVDLLDRLAHEDRGVVDQPAYGSMLGGHRVQDLRPVVGPRVMSR